VGNEGIVIGTIETPVGTYGAVLSASGLCRLTSPSEPLALCHAWADRWMPSARRLSGSGELAQVAGELLDYFAGAAIARLIGRPKAVRAVGAANGANPVALIVPCHRVIGSNGKLVGYAGGIGLKRTLLEHEQVGWGRVE
jgi:O-6-methylguanine DNA methyltransferase